MTVGEERIDAGADVIGSDGQKIGTVAYVVVCPPQLDVTDIVVSTGALLGRDVVVPVGDIDRIEGGKVYLTIDKDGADRLKDYVDVQYDTPPGTWMPPDGFAYPTGAVLWPAGAYYPRPTKVDVNAPAGTVGLHEGMDVKSSDGNTVGSVAGFDLATEGGEEDVAGIVVKEGHIFTHDVRIPVDAISGIEEGHVQLNLTRDEVKQRFGG